MIRFQIFVTRFLSASAALFLLAPSFGAGGIVPLQPGSPNITSANNATFSVGVAGSFAVTATGTPLPTISRKGPKPPSGVTVTAGSPGNGLIAGTPAAGTGGVYSFKLRATNGVPPADSQNFTLTVSEAPRFTSFAGLTCATGVFCTITITTAGFPVISSIALSSGTLPSGMTFVYNGNGTATLSGTPAAATGSTPLVFTATNSTGVATQNFTLTVNAFLAITSPAAKTCTVGQACNFTVSAQGTSTFTVNGQRLQLAVTSGTLPANLTFVDNNGCIVNSGPCTDTATLAGTPAPGTGGVYALTITATDGSPDSPADQGFTLTINEAPTIVSYDNLTCVIGGASCDFEVVSRGYPIPVVSLGGGLPSGVTSQAGIDGTFDFFGDPAANSAGSYPLVFTASNGVGVNATQNFALTVVAANDAATLTVQLLGTGTGRVTSSPSGIDCPSLLCSKIVAVGTPVTLTATPTAGAVFVGWLGGGCTGNAITCTVNMAASTTVTATFAPPGTVLSLDVDASDTATKYDAATDGTMVLRYLFGITGDKINQDAMGATATRSLADTRTYLALITPLLDIDGNGKIDALTDGLLIVRYLIGLRDPALTAGALGAGSTRNAAQIEAYLAGLTP